MSISSWLLPFEKRIEVLKQEYIRLRKEEDELKKEIIKLKEIDKTLTEMLNRMNKK